VGGYTGAAFLQHMGLTQERNIHPGMFRNFWQIGTMDTDGDDLRVFSMVGRSEPDNHAYGGAFAPDGTYFANFHPMFNMTGASGFGGVRRFRRGPNEWSRLSGSRGSRATT
jgi:hypothetical protein